MQRPWGRLSRVWEELGAQVPEGGEQGGLAGGRVWT